MIANQAEIKAKYAEQEMAGSARIGHIGLGPNQWAAQPTQVGPADGAAWQELERLRRITQELEATCEAVWSRLQPFMSDAPRGNVASTNPPKIPTRNSPYGRELQEVTNRLELLHEGLVQMLGSLDL